LKAGEQLTEMTLCALDSGTEHGRICLEYKPGYTYPAKDCSRSPRMVRQCGEPIGEAMAIRLKCSRSELCKIGRPAVFLMTWA